MKIRILGIILFFLISVISCNSKNNFDESAICLPPVEIFELPILEEYSKDKEIMSIMGKAYSYENPTISYSEAELIYESVQEEIKNYDWLKAALVYSIIESESEFKKYAHNNYNSNKTSDYSYMQVNDISIIDYNNHNWENPVTSEFVQNDTRINIMVGCWVLNKKRERLIKAGIEPTEENIVMAYNCGEKKVIRDSVPQCTIDYQKKVFVAMGSYSNADNNRWD